MRDKRLPPAPGAGRCKQFWRLSRFLGVMAAAIGLGACGGEPAPELADTGAQVSAQAAEYVGAEACAGCHEAQSQLWTGSHHDLAMQEASLMMPGSFVYSKKITLSIPSGTLFSTLLEFRTEMSS